jgi:hypothetical protein
MIASYPPSMGGEYKKYKAPLHAPTLAALATFHGATFHGTPTGASQQPASAPRATRNPPPPALPAQTGRRPGDGQQARLGLLLGGHLETLAGASSPGSRRVIPGGVPGGVEQGLEAV